MRMNRRAGIHGGVKDLVISDAAVTMDSYSWYRRIDSREDHDTWQQDTAKNWTATADLTKYAKVRFTVTQRDGSCSVSAGNVSQINPAVGEVVLDVSGIADRSSVTITVHADAAVASRPGYYPATNTAHNTIAVSKIWATKK